MPDQRDVRIWNFLGIAVAFFIGAEPTQAARRGCLSSELESVPYGPSAAKRVKAKRERAPVGELEAEANLDLLADDAHEERLLQEMYGRQFKDVIHAAKLGEFQGVPVEQLQNEWRVVRAIEKIDSNHEKKGVAGFDELSQFLTHTFKMKGKLEYLGNSGTRVSLAWRHPDGKAEVLKLPRFQRLFEVRYRAELADKRMREIVLNERILPEIALERAKRETQNATVPPLSSQSYAEFRATAQYFDALQSREDKLMAILQKGGMIAFPGRPPTGEMTPLAVLGGRVSHYVDGPDLQEVIVTYRQKMGDRAMSADELPPLLKTVVQFEDAIAGRPSKGGEGAKYSGVRREIQESGLSSFDSWQVGPLLLEGKYERADVWVDLNAGANAKVDSRFWARDARGKLLDKAQCTGALLLWVVTSRSGTCINLSVAQMPSFIDG